MKSQANELVEAVAVFKLDSSDSMTQTVAQFSHRKAMQFTGSERRLAPAAGVKPNQFSPKPASFQKTVVRPKVISADKDDD